VRRRRRQWRRDAVAVAVAGMRNVRLRDHRVGGLVLPSVYHHILLFNISMFQFELVEGGMRVIILVGPVHNKLPRLECIQQTIPLVPRLVFHSCTVGPRDVLQTNTAESRGRG
jgi:hypothetical protein